MPEADDLAHSVTDLPMGRSGADRIHHSAIGVRVRSVERGGQLVERTLDGTVIASGTKGAQLLEVPVEALLRW